MNENNRNSLVSVSNREKLSVDGVIDIRFFNESRVEMDTVLGHLSVKGKGMTVSSLTAESGEVTVEGYFYSLCYKGNIKSEKSIRERLFG